MNAVTSMRTIAVGHDVSTRELITIPGVSNARISSQAKPQFLGGFLGIRRSGEHFFIV